MSRAALVILLALVSGGGAGAGSPRRNPHVDPAIVLGGCASCHAGHGASRSPMLDRSQRDLCLDCHGEGLRRRDVAPDVSPAQVAGTFAKASAHRITSGAYSRFEASALVCTSCHSPHRTPEDRPAPGPDGKKRRAPNDPARFEHELCESCHGRAARVDIASLVDPMNRSFHPLKAPAQGRAPSTIARLAGGEINCTDCHGNDDVAGPRGPHGSNIPHLLRRAYRTADGAAESDNAFELCYSCHDRRAVLDASPFPMHREHIVEMRTSCATCHDAHGSPANRALIRFGTEQHDRGSVLPSARTGRLAYVSEGPGSGACYLNCHGEEHAPEAYGSMKLQLSSALSVPAPAEPPRMPAISPPSSLPWPEGGPGKPTRRTKQ